MKKTTLFSLILTLFLGLTNGYSQKVAIIGMNHLSGATTDDGFTFVATESIPAGEIIYFTDNEYDDSGNAFTFGIGTSGEGVIIYTVGANGLNIGDVVFVNETGSNTFTVTCTSGTNCGSAIASSTFNNGGFNLATNGDGLYAYSDTNQNVTDGITAIYSVMYTGSGEAPQQNGGIIPTNENPLNDYPNAIVVDGFNNDGDPFVGPDRVEYKFNPISLRDAVNKVLLENPVNYLQYVSQQGLSVIPFTSLNLTGSNPIATVAISPTNLNENSGSSYTYTFSLDSNATINTTINFSVSGSAILNTDYTQSGATTFNSTSGSVIITSGTSSKTITITPVGDSTLEPDENIVLTLASGTGYDSGSPSTATAVITNDDSQSITPLVAITGANNETTEGFSFVALNDIAAGTVIYFTDNEFNNSSLTFNSGEFVASWTAPIGGILRGEVIVVKETSTNSFTTSCNSGACGIVSLHSGNFALATNGETINAYTDIDNDPTNGITSIQAVLYTGNSSNSGGNIPVIEDPTSVYSGSVLVDGFSSGIIPNRTEYNPTLRTVDVDQANFQNTTNWLYSQSNQDLSIVPFSNIIITTGSPNPVATVAISPTNVIEDSGNALVYTFSLDSPASGDVVLNFTVGGTGTFTTDYTVTGSTNFNSTNGSVTILDGTSSASVNITPVIDTAVETLEDIELIIASGIGYNGGSPNNAIGTISNDDTSNSDPLVAISGMSHLTTDGFSFVAIRDIPASTIVYFSEDEFDNTTLKFSSGEALIQWTSPAGGIINKGDVIVVTESGTDIFTSTCSDSSGNGCGTITVIQGNSNLSTGGDSLYAFTDDDTDPTNGVTDIHSVMYTGGPSGVGGSIPINEDPSSIYLNALVVDGFPTSNPNRTEYDETKRNVLVENADFENVTNWVHAQSPPALSTTPFTNLAILIAPTITFNDINKTYGDVSFDLAATSNSTGNITYSIIGPANGTSLAGTNNETVALGNAGTVTIRATQASDGITYGEATKDITLTIGKAALTVTANASQTKVYGTTDPTLTYTITGFVNADVEGDLDSAVSISRAAGENVGNYTITPAGAADTNYNVSFVTAQFSITKAALTVTANASQTKVYGATDPTLTYTITGFVNADVEGDLDSAVSISRAAGEDVGNYTIMLSGGFDNNYSFNLYNGIFTIIKKEITITADPKSKTYCNTDPELTYQITEGNLVIGDSLSGSLMRSIGENVGDYEISIGTLNAGLNYNITFIPSQFSITIKTITISCPPNLIINTDLGSCSTTGVDLGTVLINGDDCSDAIVSNNAPDVFPKGNTIVTWTVKDNLGNISEVTCEQIVTVNDNEIPTVITQDITILLDSDGLATISSNQIDDGSTDNCSIDTMTLDITNFDCSNLGENTVTLTVTDIHGNTSNKRAIVTVEDNTVPTVITQDITIELDGDGIASITSNQINNGSSDNCSIDTITLDITSFDCSNIGENTVTLTVTDINNNMARNTAIVTIVDPIAPIAICVAPFTIELDDTGNAMITADDINNGSTDNCSITSLTIDKDSFDCSSIGEHTITLTVTDMSGNSADSTTLITVVDRTNPIVITKNIDVELDENGQVEITPLDIDDESFDSCGIASRSLNKTSFDCPTLGDHIVTLTIVDSNGNSSSEEAVITITADDIDGDLIADVCDDDMDGDGVNNDLDNCPTNSNPDQADLDRNGIGNVCDTAELETPKGFSPNRDGVNDYFIIAGLHKYPDNKIEIFNRWGNLVYKSENYQNYWDGIAQGKGVLNKNELLPAGPYFYVLSINGGQKIIKEWVYINY